MESTYSTSSLVGFADAAELAGDAEVEADRFGVADVEVAVGLGWKAGVDLGILLLRDVGGDDVADKVGRRGRGGFRALGFSSVVGHKVLNVKTG
jgi:hypothetical protein